MVAMGATMLPAGRFKSGALVCFLLAVVLVVPAHTRYHGSRHKRQHGAEMYLPSTFIVPGGDEDSRDWSGWSSPSECSRSCGGGVAYQTRDCLASDQRRCVGGNRKYFSCNTQDCPDHTPDFRAHQCAHFNDLPFQGVRYNWVPYTRAPNPCELNCMPRGERFYFRHKTHVIDGTRCTAESLDVCVAGQCQPVGCDMQLGSEAREDKCGKCAGDGSSCRTDNGTLTQNDLQVGYNDMLLIPAGATNIDIKEVAPSNNYLAVRNASGQYHLNGNWRIDLPRTLTFAGAIWHYDRKPQGFAAPDHITCHGPTTEPVYLVLLYQDRNVGIRYEYSVPEKQAHETTAETYTWSFKPFAPCSTTCGGGVQEREVLCVGQSLVPVDETLCDVTSRPARQQQCALGACAPRWVEGDFEKCSKPCGEEGTQTRAVRCEQLISANSSEVVDDAQCLEQVGNKPATVSACNVGVVCPLWHIGKWQACNKLCGDGVQKRQVRCYRKEGTKIVALADDECIEPKPEAEQPCILRPCEGVDWITSEWSTCKACGLTVETRSAVCGSKLGKVYNESFCANHEKPELERPCETTTPCNALWFRSQWSGCSADCGAGVQTRTVFCGTLEEDGGVKRLADETACVEAKPNATQECTGEGKDCDGEWFSGPWSACSKNCGGGQKTRSVLCLAEGAAVPATRCSESDIVFSTDECNKEACSDDAVIPVDVTSKPIVEDDDVGEDWCEEGEEGAEEGSGFDDSGVTVAVGDSVSDVSGGAIDFDESTSESTFTTDDLMQSDEPYISLGTTASGDGDLEKSSTVEGSGAGDVSIASRLDDGSGDDAIISTTIATDVSQNTEYGSSIADSSDVTDSSTDSADLVTIISSIATTDGTDVSEQSTDANTENTETSSTAASQETTGTEAGSEATSTEASQTETPTSETTPEVTTELTSTDISTTESATEATSESITQSTESGTDDTTIAETTQSSSISPESTETELSLGSTTDVSATSASDSDDSTTIDSVSGISDATTIEGVTESAGSTVTEDADATTDSSTDESNVTEDNTTVTGATDISTESVTDASTTDITDISGTTSSSDIDQTTVDIFSRIDDSTDDDDGVTNAANTTPNTLSTIISAELKPRKCRPRPKIAACVKSTFGCCADNTTAATGPFDEGCAVPKTCADTKYGCCPDGLSPARGKKNAGCPEPPCQSTLFGCCASDGLTESPNAEGDGCPIATTTTTTTTPAPTTTTTTTTATPPTTKVPSEAETTLVPDVAETTTAPKDCSLSTYGCCPDGVSEATGPDHHGCAACNSEPFGCCRDGETPSHGPNGEGCCLSSEFGCCPDNVNKARGPNLEDCGCAYAPYGCCPDNVTAARGHDNEGCGCEWSEHGCCLDRVTPAQGPSHEGCPCHTFQFGCCPDGVTRMADPHGYGCDCSHTPHKCCGDGKTAAGPDGCTCEHSRYGCCLDGVTSAQGSRFEGCAEKPEEAQKACSAPKDQGDGMDYKVRYFFDVEYGSCSRFWWGGQGGNANRYLTEAECKQTCMEPTGRSSCALSAVHGPCNGRYQMYYYDAQAEQCRQFVYGGCLGNNNRYETLEACKAQCVVDRSSPPCDQPMEQGPCNGTFENWFFDKESDVCRPFLFGGCKGNANRYATESSCNFACKKPGVQKTSCAQPKEAGSGSTKHARWYYAKQERKCLPFYYTGSGGNRNSFTSVSDCEAECPKQVAKGICELAAEIGEGSNYTTRWYFDTLKGNCRQFYYGGYGGNANNFQTEESCAERCKQPERVTRPTPAERPQEPQRPQEPERQPESEAQGPFDKQSCLLDSDAGDCRVAERRYHYNRTSGRCEVFAYGGCGGNANNFHSVAECEQRCDSVPVEVDNRFDESDENDDDNEIGVCQQRLDSGPCRNWTTQYAYNPKARICVAFRYGGCAGNRNRFPSLAACQRSCGDRQRPSGQEQQPDDRQRSRPRPPTVERKSYCLQPVERGECPEEQEPFERWHFEEASEQCRQFTYAGCGGNLNNFRTLESCERGCAVPAVNPCDRHAEACADLQCPYGVHRSYDADSCERCECVDPCRDHRCPEQSQCKVDLTSDPHEGTQFIAVCRPTQKSGECPVIDDQQQQHDQHNCSTECHSDADCRGDNKCCTSGCSYVCVAPAEPTTEAPEQAPEPRPREPANYPGAQPAGLEERRPEEVDVVQAEGAVATLRCFATGYPLPTVTWRFGAVILNTNQGRYVIASNGDLQIVQVHQSDSGTYVCIADNGIGAAVEREVQLRIAEPRDLSAYVHGPANSTAMVTLGRPATIRCLAGGIPRPTVTWWRGADLLPISGQRHQMAKDYSLTLSNVTLLDLGSYMCHAYTGMGKPATLQVTLQTYGPVQATRPAEQPYLRYVLSRPRPAPQPQQVEQKWRRPVEPQVDDDRQQQQRPAKLPEQQRETVETSIILNNGNTFAVGTDIAIPCQVRGYPQPNVTWSKDGVDLQSDSQHIQITDSHRLLIFGATDADSGYYRCSARNEFSSAYHAEQINVQGAYIPADCQDSPYFANCKLIVKGKYCGNKYYSKFCCRACTMAGMLQHSYNGLH